MSYYLTRYECVSRRATFSCLPGPSRLGLPDEGAENIGLVGENTFPGTVFPPQNVGLDLFDGEILVLCGARKREFESYGRDVSVDTRAGVRKVRLLDTPLSRT